MMASSSVAKGGESSSTCIVGAPIKKLVSPSPPQADDDDDNDDDDEFSRLLNAHKKARDDGEEYPSKISVPSGNIQPAIKRQRVNYGDIEGATTSAAARRYTFENPRRKGGLMGGTRPIEHTSMGLVPPRPLRFPFPPYCGPLAKLVSNGPPPPLPVDQRSIMLQQLLERVQYLTNENERLTYIVADQQTLLSGGGGAAPPTLHPIPHPPSVTKGSDASPSPTTDKSKSGTILPPWRSKKATIDTTTVQQQQPSIPLTHEDKVEEGGSSKTEDKGNDDDEVMAEEDGASSPIDDIGLKNNVDMTVG